MQRRLGVSLHRRRVLVLDLAGDRVLPTIGPSDVLEGGAACRVRTSCGHMRLLVGPDPSILGGEALDFTLLLGGQLVGRPVLDGPHGAGQLETLPRGLVRGVAVGPP